MQLEITNAKKSSRREILISLNSRIVSCPYAFYKSIAFRTSVVFIRCCDAIATRRLISLCMKGNSVLSSFSGTLPSYTNLAGLKPIPGLPELKLACWLIEKFVGRIKLGYMQGMPVHE